MGARAIAPMLAGALLAGCGTQLPVGATGAMQQSRAAEADRPGHGYALSVLFQFDISNGDDPIGNVVYLDGSFYGNTALGGAHGAYGGVTYGVTPSGKERTLHVFGGGEDGVNPIDGLAIAHHELFGATIYGGKFGSGAAFALDTKGNERVVHSFGHGSDGSYPQSGLINLNGTLYGTTSEGGRGQGTVYSIDSTGREKVVYRFRGGRDGSSPERDVTAVDGVLYGTTPSGGNVRACKGGCGTIFALTTAGKERVIYRFGHEALGSESIGPSYLVGIKNVLYGTTGAGGVYHEGTLFKTTLSGRLRILHHFTGGLDGAYPGGLIDINGTLYGRTGSGGRNGGGTIFTLTPSGQEDVIYNFKQSAHGPEDFLELGNALYGTLGEEYGAFFRLAH